MKRPNLSISDARALEEQATTIQFVDIELGAGRRPADAGARLLPRPAGRKPLVVFGTTEHFAAGTRIPMLTAGRFFNGTELQYRRNVVVLGNTPYQAAVRAERHRSDRQDSSASAAERFEVVGVFDKRPGRRRIQPRPGRLRRHPVHRLPAASSGCASRSSAAAATRDDACRFRSRSCRARASTRRTRSPTSSGSCASATA